MLRTPTLAAAVEVRVLQVCRLLNLCQSLPLGVYQAWTCVLNLNLDGGAVSMTDTQAGWLGLWMTLSGCLGGMVLGAVMDRFAGRLKTGIIILTALSVGGYAVFALITSGQLDLDHASLVNAVYIAGIAGGLCLNASLPLYFELTLESIFGFADESAATSLMILTNTVVQVVFLAIPTRINGSSEWMNSRKRSASESNCSSLK